MSMTGLSVVTFMALHQLLSDCFFFLAATLHCNIKGSLISLIGSPISFFVVVVVYLDPTIAAPAGHGGTNTTATPKE